MTVSNARANAVEAGPTSVPINRRALLAVGGSFALKAAVGVVILAMSAKQLSVDDFASFSQLFLFLALLASVASGGVQNGVIREVAAANGDRRVESVVVLAGILIWGCVSIAVALGVFLLRTPISIALFGRDALGVAVVQVTFLALAAGLGTLLNSALSGSGRTPFSLVLQSLGLVMGGAMCAAALYAGEGVGAVLLYALGPLLAVAITLWVSRHWLRKSGAHWPEVRDCALDLIKYSGTFLIVVTALPLVLFAVRYVYRLEFGAELLGYWLLANRASDVTTQVVGMYLSQVYLPQATRVADATARRTLMWRTLALCMGVAGIGALLFAVASGPIISLALSDRFLPALPFILGYLIGDVFRVGGNLALFTVLAAKRLVLFVAIEVGLALLVGCAILAGIGLGHGAAAYWGYIAAHVTGFVFVLFCMRRLARIG